MVVLDAAKAIEQIQESAKSGKRSEILGSAAEAVRASGKPYTSVYMYMLDQKEEDLVLEAFSGRETEHQRIRVGHGVCGTAVAEKKDQNVGDVQARENYIACNRFTRSELVVLIRKGDKILGQIDVDSDELNPFGSDEEAALRVVADAVGKLL